MKKKVTRLISAVLSAAMALTSIPLSAFAEGEVHEHASNGSTAVTERLDFASKTEDESGNGWSWEADTKTLTLDSADISCATTLSEAQLDADIAVVYVPDKTEIVLVGESTIEQTSAAADAGVALCSEGSITFSGDGVLNIKNATHFESLACAIYAQDSSVIVNGGTVNAENAVLASTVEVHNNGVLNAKATAYSMNGAAVDANVTVDGNGTLTAVGSAYEDSSNDNGAIRLDGYSGKMTVKDSGSVIVPADNAAKYGISSTGVGGAPTVSISGGKISAYGTSVGLSNVVLNMSGTGSVYATGNDYATLGLIYKESDYFMTAGSAAYGTEESAVTETELTKDEYDNYFIGAESVKTLVVKPETRQKIILGNQIGRFTVTSMPLYEDIVPMECLDGTVSFDIVPLNISDEELASATAVISDSGLTAKIYEDGDNWVCTVSSIAPYGGWYQYVEGVEDAELYITYGNKKSNTQTVRIKQDYYDDMDVRASQQYPTLYTNAPDSVKQDYYVTVDGSTSDGTVTNSWYVRGDSKYTLDQLGEVLEDGTKFKISDEAPMGNFTVYCDTVRTKTDGTKSVLTNKFSFEKKECKHENGYDRRGKCKDCETECPHDGDIDADTGKCKTCGLTVKSAVFTNDKSEVTLFDSEEDLKSFFDSNSTVNGTLKLFSDIVFSNSGEPIYFGGNVTIDFNGKTFNGGIGSSAGKNTITLENSSDARATAFSLSTAYGSKAVVNGNILFKDVVTAGSGGGIIVLNNGEYTGLQQNNSGKTVYDMLGDKKAFYNSDGTVLNVGGMQSRSTSEAAVTVKAHEHTFVGNNCECGFVCEHEVNADTGVCGKCGYKFTALIIKDGAVASVYNQTETASAFASADSEENKGCTLELFGDYSGDYTTLSGEFTLLLAGGVNAGDLTVTGNITISGDENARLTYVTFTVNGGTLVFDENCSVSGTVTAGEGSCFECYGASSAVTLNITGEDSEILLAGGLFDKISYTGGGNRANDSVLTLLAPEKAFWGVQQSSVIDGSIYKLSDGISKVIIYPHENHAYDSTTGKCTECGAYCDHSDVNTDTGVCGDCGHEFALGVLSDSGNKFYDDADTVFEDLPNGKTVKLYKNCSISSAGAVSNKKVTVDLNGFTLGGDLTGILVSNSTFNVIDSKSGGVFDIDILVRENSVLEVGTEDGENDLTIKCISVTTENGGKLNMYGGVCDTLDIDAGGENIAANINIYGGTVKSIRCSSLTATLNMLLADGSAFENENGEIIDAYAVDFFVERNNINVTAVKHTHSYSHETGKCACGAYPLAMFTESGTGNISFVTTVNELQTLAADEYRDGVITLTEDISNSLTIKGVKTVDFNGHKFSGTILSEGNITFANSSSNRAEITTSVYVFNKLTVNGDILFGSIFRATVSTADIVLNSGTYTTIVAPSGKTVFDLLPKGKALAKFDVDGSISVGLYDAGVSTAYEENFTLKIVAHPEHDFDEHGHCGCGYQCAHSAIDTESNLCKECNAIMCASVTADSGSKVTVKYFTRLTDAFDFAAKDANKGCTVKMLRSYANNDNIVVSAGKFTIDLNGFQLTHNELFVNEGAELTIKSDSENYNSGFDWITVNGGSLAVIGNEAHTTCPNIVVNGGSFSMDAENVTVTVLTVENNASAAITCGKFKNLVGSTANILSKGSCVYDLNSKEELLYENFVNTSYPTYFGVKRCEHSNVSDSGLCAYCNTQFYEKLSYTADGVEKTEYFDNTEEAFNKANSVQTATMTIIKNPGDRIGKLELTGDLTLIVNDYFDGIIKPLSGAKLAVSGSGYLYCIEAANGSRVTVADGARLGDVTINGEGKIGECSIDILTTSGKIADFLADGYAFKNDSGEWLTLEEREKSSVMRVTVEKAPIASATVTADKTVLYRNAMFKQILFKFNVNTSDGYTVSNDNMVTVGLYVGDTLIKESDFGGNSSTFANASEISDTDGTVKAHLVLKLNGYEYVTNEVEFELATCTHPYEFFTKGDYSSYICSQCEASIYAILAKENGDKVCYDNAPDAFKAAQLEENNGCTLEIYRDIGRNCEATQGEFTVSFMESKITISALITVSGGNVTFTGKAAKLSYEGDYCIVSVAGGKAIFDNAEFEDDIKVSGGKAVINSGTYNNLSVSGGTAELNGGTFSSISVSAEGKTLTDLLGEKKAFTTEDGALFNAYVTESSVTLTVTDHESHNFSDYGYCECGYQCPHDDLDTENVCRECNAKMYAAVIVKSGSETDEDGDTITNGEETDEAEEKVYYFVRVTEAFEFAAKSENEGCTLKMLRDFAVTDDERININVERGKFTFDLNGCYFKVSTITTFYTEITICSDKECTFEVDEFELTHGGLSLTGKVKVYWGEYKMLDAAFRSEIETFEGATISGDANRVKIAYGGGLILKCTNRVADIFNMIPAGRCVKLRGIGGEFLPYTDSQKVTFDNEIETIFILKCDHEEGVGKENLSEDNRCLYCNTKMFASVSYTKDGADKTEYFAYISKAFDKANSVASATVTMINDFGYTEDDIYGSDVTVTGNVTFYLKDHLLNNNVTVAGGGKLTLRGNEFISDVIAEAGSKVSVEETVSMNNLTVNGGDVKLSGGQHYESITVNGGKITDLLADGYAFKSGGEWLTLEEREVSEVSSVTVAKAPIASATVTADKTVLYRNAFIPQILFKFNINTSDGYTVSKDNMVTVGLYVGDTLIKESDFGGNSYAFANADEISDTDGTVKAHLVLKLNGYEYVTNDVEFEIATCTHPYDSLTTDEYDYYRCSLCDSGINAILVKTNGDKVCYTDNVPEAFEAAQLEENNGCTLELYRCATGDCEITKGSFTILFKKTVSASAVIKVSGGNVKITGDDGCAVLKYTESSVGYLVAVTGGTVTFDNITIDDDSISVSGGKAVINGGTYNKLSVSGGAAELNGGTYSTLNVSGGTAELNGGTYSVLNVSGGTFAVNGGTYNELNVSGGTAELNGGTFSSIDVSAEGKALKDLLGEKKAFAEEDGTLYDANLVVSFDKLTVIDHESHYFDIYGYCTCGYECPHGDVDTEAGVCRECNANMNAVVTVKSETETTVKYFARLTKAFEFAAKSENRGCTVTMLRRFYDDGADIDVKGGDFTVDMNGFDVYIKSFNGSGTKITIRSDSKCTFAVENGFTMVCGTVTFSGEVSVVCDNMKLTSVGLFSDVETLNIDTLILDHGITSDQQVKIASAYISNVNCGRSDQKIYLYEILAYGSRIGYQLYSDLKKNCSSSFDGVYITRCDHPDGVDGNNCCIYCNALMAASVSYTEDGAEKTEYFVAEDLGKAFDKANSVSSATVTMLRSSACGADYLTVTVDVTLIANDYKALYNTVKVADGGKLTVRGNVKGYFEGVIAEAGSKVTVEEAVRIINLTVNGGDVKLSGGQYGSITVNDGKITDILGNGYAYKKTEGGEWLTLEEREVSEVSGVTVAKAPIARASLSVGTPTVYRNASNDEAGYIFDVAVSDGYTIDSEHKLNVKTYADGNLIEAACEDCDRNTDLMCVPIDELAPNDGVVKVHLVITFNGYEIKTNTIEIKAATCEHSYSLITTDQDGKYHCGTCHSFISAVLTTADGENVCYVDMSKAFEDAQLEENSGCTLKLYSDTETSYAINNGSFTVDFGETGTTTNGVITVSGGNVTFTGKAGVLNDIYDGCIVKVTGGKATFDNAELEGSIAVSGGEVVINSGTYDMLATSGGDVELNGGTYRVLLTSADGKKVYDMLGEKKALTREVDGTLIDAGDVLCYLDEGLIKVADHESHTFSNGKCDCGYYCKHDNIDTDTGKCADCDIAPVANITYGDGVTKGFNSLVDAFEFISKNAPENCVLTVTDDVQIGEDEPSILVDNDFTMQFKSAKGRNNVKISGGNITFTGNVVIRNVWDQSVGNKIESTLNQNGGSFTVEGESDLSINGKFTLRAGDLNLDSYATTFADMTINNDIYHTPNIINATFIKLTLVDRTLADVMTKDSYVETIQGNNPVKYDNIKDSSELENIHITSCTHFFNESFVIDDNGICPYCNHKYFTKVNYEYENGIKGLAYFDTLKEAVEIANDADKATITLLSECEEADVPAITSDVKLVLGGRFKNTITVADGGKLTLSGDNTLYKLKTEEGSQLDVYGNSIIEYAEINGSATLADCTIYFLNTSGKLSALLAKGYGYKAEQIGWLTLEDCEKSEASFVTVTKAPISGAELTVDKTKVYREGENDIKFTVDVYMADGFPLDVGHGAGYKLYIAGEEEFSTGIYTSSYSDAIWEGFIWNDVGKDGKIKAYAVISYDGYEVLTNELEIEAVTCKNPAEKIVKTEDGKYKCSECDNYVCFEITTKSGDAEYTYSITDALERIQSDTSYNGSTIKTVTERSNISYTGYDVDGVDLTFDLNGHYADISSKMTVSNSTVVFKDSAGNGTFGYYGGGVKNEGITFKNSVVTVESGKYNSVFNIGEGCTVKLNGGTFFNIEINDGDKTLYDLLGENKAFETESGLLFDAGSTTYSSETLKVVEHKHTFNYYGKCDCGAQYSASVSYKDGETEKTEYFKDIAKAFEKANSLESATVTTLNNIENSDEVIPVTGNVTFNVGRPVYRTLNVASGGKLTLVGEEYKNIYRVKTEAGSQLTVSGNILIENAEINGSASISGGKILLLVTSGKISDVLADGYAFKDINEEWLTVEERSMSEGYCVTIEKAPIVEAKLSADKTKAYRNGTNYVIFTISADMANGVTVDSDNRMNCTLYIAGNIADNFAYNKNNSMRYIRECYAWNYAGKDGKAKVYTVVSYDGYEVLTNELELETVTCKNSAEKVVKTSDGKYKCSECDNYVYYEITSKDGASEYTYSITDAFERIQQASSYNGCVIKSVCETEKFFSGADVKGADFTFDLNGYRAAISSKMTITDSTVVFKDSAGEGIFSYYSGKIGNEGITFKNSNITVESGGYYSIFNIGEGCTVNLTGGTFGNIEIHDGDKTLHDLLGEGKAFATDDGKLFDAYSVSSSDELLTVIDHSKHEFDENHHCGCGFTCTEHKGGKATCTAKAICEICGGEYGEMLPHSYTEKVDKQYLKSAVTCTEKAVYYTSCAVCGQSSKDTADEATFEYGNALGHKYSAWVSNGDGTHTRVCANDNSHTETKDCHGGKVTCTAKAVCEDCGAEYGEMLPHSFTAKNPITRYLKKAATCTEKSEYYVSCADCGLSTKGTNHEAVFEGSALGHDLTDWSVTEATCTENGSEERHCTRCDYEQARTIAAKGHSYGSWKVTKKATCIADGEQTRECSVCKHKDVRAIAATGIHTFGAWKVTKAATCTATGIKERACADCGAKEQITLQATGHKYVTSTVKPTYTSKGYTLHKCSVCGNSYKSDYTAALVLAPVSGLKRTARTSTTVTLGWNRNSAADGYIVERYNGKAWVSIAKITSNSTITYTAKSLTPSTTNKFRVKAYKSTAYSAYSYVTVNTIPSAVTGFKATSKTSTTATLSWTKNSSAGGYIIEYYNGTKWVQSANVAGGATVKTTVKGLKAGSSVKLRIKAYKVIGSNTVYSAYTQLTVKTKPTDVTGLKVSSKTNNTVKLQWNKNTSADSYVVEKYSGGKWVQVTKISGNAVTSYTMNGLKSSTTYKLRIKAAKSGEYSNCTYINVTTKPYAVNAFKAKSVSKSAITLQWNKNTSADGYCIERYNGTKWVQVQRYTSNASTTYTIKSLKAGTTYKFRIRAYKTVGNTAEYSTYTYCNVTTKK